MSRDLLQSLSEYPKILFLPAQQVKRPAEARQVAHPFHTLGITKGSFMI
jgi:hypothetical protein